MKPIFGQRLRAALKQHADWYRNRWLRISAVVVVVYALLGFALAPALLRHYLPRFVQESLPAQATLGDLRINPFLLTLEARDFALLESNGNPLFKFKRLFVNAELSSLLHRAWTTADISLEQPEIDVVQESDGRLNLQRLFTAAAPLEEEQADQTNAGLPRLWLQQIKVSRGTLRFSDVSGKQPASTVLAPIDLSFSNIATIPGRDGAYAAAAELPGGGRLSWEGKVGLSPLSSSGTFRLERFEPRTLWDFAREHVQIAEPQGTVEASADYHIVFSSDTVMLRTEAMQLKVADLALGTAGATRLFDLQAIELRGARFDLAARELLVPEIRLRNGALGARLDADGLVNWSKLLTPGAAPSTAEPQTRSAPWRIILQSVALEQVGLELQDLSRAAPLTLAANVASLAFNANAVIGNDAPALRIGGLGMELDSIALSAKTVDEPLLRVASLRVEDGSVDTATQKIDAARVALKGVATAVTREADGTLAELALLAAPANADPSTPWRYRVAQIDVSELSASLTDASTGSAIHYSIAGGSVIARGIQNADSTPLVLEAKLPLQQGGEVTVTGKVAGDGSSADMQLHLDAVALLPLAPLVTQATTLTLDSGTLSADGTFVYRASGADQPLVLASGTLGVADLLLNETASGERFLQWRSLAASGVEFGLDPDHLAIAELRVTDAGAKIVVFKDRSTNLGQVMREHPDAPPVTDPGAATPALFPITIDRVRLDGTTLDFADLGLILPFAARIEQLKGVAGGISSASDSRATVAFSGRVGPFGEAEIDGLIAPFDPTRFTDIEVSFRNIAMDTLSPYSATFAGRTIESGDLDLGLEYKVTDGALQGENHIGLQDLKLGKSVNSPDAMELPLDLAIALLQDSKGRIDLTVPVRGNVGEPTFDYGLVVRKAIGNVLKGIVTAPFRALGSLFGGDDKSSELEAVRFKSGSAELMPREQERIATLAKALVEKPLLAVRVPPGFNTARDGFMLRKLQIRRDLAALAGLEVVPDEDPGPVAYDNAKTQRALETLFAERHGEAAVAAFAAEFAQSAGREPERVNPALALIGRASEDREFYRAMYLRLVKITPEPLAELQALAQARATAVIEELVARGIDAARATRGKQKPFEPAQPSGVLLPLQLEALKK